MSKDRFDVLERFEPLFEAPEPSFEGFIRRRDRKRRTQRIAAVVVGVAVFVAPIWIVATGVFDRTFTPGGNGSLVIAPDVPTVDYMIDLNTGAMTPLPDAIIRSLAVTAEVRSSGSLYAASPDGSQLAWVGTDDDGNLQIFTAGIDGSGAYQATHDPRGATSPAWSPDGTRIAYVGAGSARTLFFLDVATGASTMITTEPVWGPQFTPDGASLIYTCCSGPKPQLRISPVTGGNGTLLIGLDGGLRDSGDGSMSPDGSLVTFLGGGELPGAHCGPCRLVANVDGSHLRVLGTSGCKYTDPAGTWSPDGKRIVCWGDASPTIYVADIATGNAIDVAEGVGAIWLDDHTLLVEV